MPEVLRLGHNYNPRRALFAHMYYHFAISLLFRPLIKLRIVGSKVSPRDVCSQAADAIQGLLTAKSRLYTLQRTPAFVPDFALTSSIMHLAVGAVAVQTGALDSEQDTTVKIDRHVSDILRQGVAGHDRAHELVTEAIARHWHWVCRCVRRRGIRRVSIYHRCHGRIQRRLGPT
ncbi:hypothetical protein V1522DRAFT_415990, partial [Lipomyces starkeyi]